MNIAVARTSSLILTSAPRSTNAAIRSNETLSVSQAISKHIDQNLRAAGVCDSICSLANSRTMLLKDILYFKVSTAELSYCIEYK